MPHRRLIDPVKAGPQGFNRFLGEPDPLDTSLQVPTEDIRVEKAVAQAAQLTPQAPAARQSSGKDDRDKRIAQPAKTETMANALKTDRLTTNIQRTSNFVPVTGASIVGAGIGHLGKAGLRAASATVTNKDTGTSLKDYTPERGEFVKDPKAKTSGLSYEGTDLGFVSDIGDQVTNSFQGLGSILGASRQEQAMINKNAAKNKANVAKPQTTKRTNAPQNPIGKPTQLQSAGPVNKPQSVTTSLSKNIKDDKNIYRNRSDSPRRGGGKTTGKGTAGGIRASRG